MLQGIHQKLGTAGFIIAIVAMVAALGGGAYAASGGLTGKQKKEVEKIARSVSKPGKTGPAGPAGAAGAKGDGGAKGDAGAAGATGPAGANGTNGTNGTPGKNGTNGTTGFTKTLPGEATETGVWSFGVLYIPEPQTKIWRVPLSFTIPLVDGISATGCETVVAGPPSHVGDACKVHYIGPNGKELVGVVSPVAVEQTVCMGTVSAPTAPPGNLCVYEAALEGAELGSADIIAASAAEPEGTSSAGAVLRFMEAGNEANGWGSWAVTAEEE